MTQAPIWRNPRLDDRPGKLANRYVFLSASIPDRDLDIYLKPENAHLDIEEAVVSLARAVFAEEGRLVFGGHPSISPLVASIAGDYYLPAGTAGNSVAPPVSIYQSRCYEGHIPDTTSLLRDMGFAEIVWTDAAPAERFDAMLKGRQCMNSVYLMRDRMLSDKKPAAMVAIGGMDGVEDEARRLGLRKNTLNPVYLFRSTWGAAARMAKNPEKGMIIAEERWKTLIPVVPDGANLRRKPTVPYPLLMQRLVAEISTLP